MCLPTHPLLAIARMTGNPVIASETATFIRQGKTDPLNPNRIWNGIKAYNHYFYMPRSGPTPLVKSVKGVARGLVSRHKLPTKEFVVGDNRTVYLYQPAVKTPVPLVVVYDGPDYLKRGRLNVIVDNLIAAQRIRPFAMAMVQNGGQARSLEYSGGHNYTIVCSKHRSTQYNKE